MSLIKVWDFPTRLFHWLLVVTFGAAFVLAQFTHERGQLFPVHALLGLVTGLLVLLRTIWGFTGSRYARFSSFMFNPGEVVIYLRDTLTGKGERYTGHNPGSAYAVFAMLILLAALVLTGLLNQNGNEAFEGLHELFAYAMIVTVGMHVLGVIWHIIRHKENIIAGMITGTKEGKQSEGILSYRPLAGLVFLLLTGSWTLGIFSAYDSSTRQTVLPVIGTAIQLGEHGDDEGKPYNGDRDNHEYDDD